MPEISVNIKSAATRNHKIKTLLVPYDEGITDVRCLIEATVRYCVAQYNYRVESSELLCALSVGQIEEGASHGKVSFGVNYGGKKAELTKAISDALEAFADGIAVIFADEKRLEGLDEHININAIKSLTFVKLTMLAGRMW